MFLAVLGLCCGWGFSLLAGSRGESLVIIQGLPIVAISLAVEGEQN